MAGAIRAGITGIGAAQGSKLVTNEEIGAPLGISSEWIVERSGIRERRILGEGQQLVDLITASCTDALAVAGRDAADVDLFLVATLTPDDLCPAQSVSAAEALGIPQSTVVADLNAACTGFVTSLGHAAAMVESGRAQCALVCGADALSRVTDFSDPKSAPLFGDGAGAVIVQAVDGAGIGPMVGGHDNQRRQLHMTIADRNIIHMRGREVYTNAVARISDATLKSLAAVGKTIDQMDMLVAHQANARIIEAVGEKLGLRTDQAVLEIEDVGNTSSASIPIALTRLLASGRLAEGATAVLTGFGGGYVWSSLVVEFGPLVPVAGAAGTVGLSA
ncbi:MAG: beta-ketoacyl-ACP synthase 3 [Thermoleophilaceae bacterium]|nr:beta-ketoacyl-ACP synthase 3 [Thermoleophilaceae bacterium]